MGEPKDNIIAQGDGHIDIDAELAKFEAEERKRLGLDAEETDHWTDNMTAPVFTKSQRAKTTILLGGLTMAHDYLIEGALKGIGYEARALSVADNTSLRFGKEFGNRGQCNPTYFTVGNLVKELCRLRDEEGLTSQEVIDGYAFVTAGACGPCRFGMYVTEYRKALRDAGFDGFRVLLFQQTGGVKQATGEELGLVLNPTFFWALARAMFTGDVINVLQYRLRPFEVEEGSTDRAIEAVKKTVYDTLADPEGNVLKALWQGRKILRAVKLDRMKAKPKVAIIGEFWAMTTEGDGSYHIQRFLEQEGAEVQIQVMANVLLYNIWEFRHDTEARLALKGADSSKFGLADTDVGLLLAGLWLGEFALRTIWQSFAKVLGLHFHVLPDMDAIAKVGHSHYNTELRGGEGHLEVAKLILNVVKKKAHMTVSIKPFGCMPSSGVSDGVQSVITELYPEAIFCPVETNGDGAVNFYSRVQMYLFKARQRAREQYEATLEKHGVTEEQVREFVDGKIYGHPLWLPPHLTAGTSTDLIEHVAPLIGTSRLGRAKVHAGRFVKGVKTAMTETWPKRLHTARRVAPHLPALGRYIATELSDSLPGPKAAWNRLVNRVTSLTEDEERQVREAEAAMASAPAPTDQPTGGLPVMA